MSINVNDYCYSEIHDAYVKVISMEEELSEIQFLDGGGYAIMETKFLRKEKEHTDIDEEIEEDYYDLTHKRKKMPENEEKYHNYTDYMKHLREGEEEEEDIRKVEESEPLEKGNDKEEDIKENNEEEEINTLNYGGVPSVSKEECCNECIEEAPNEQLIKALEEYDKKIELEVKNKCIGFATYMLAKYMSNITISENDYNLWKAQFN